LNNGGSVIRTAATAQGKSCRRIARIRYSSGIAEQLRGLGKRTEAQSIRLDASKIRGRASMPDIPLLEEYCYDDFGALKELLGGELVDSEAGRIREEIFGANREGDLIQAVSFEEMQPLVLDQEPVDSELTGDPSDSSSDDNESEDESKSAS
jgi:hypothetical protein